MENSYLGGMRKLAPIFVSYTLIFYEIICNLHFFSVAIIIIYIF